MNCEQCKELLVSYVEDLLEESQKQVIESHLKACPPCRAEADQIVGLRERLAANGKALAQSDLEERVLNRIVQEQSSKLREVSKSNKQIQLWRKIMKSRITKLAAAAVIIIAAVLSISVLDNFVTPAYAIEQTIEVNNNINSFHFKYYSSLQNHNNHNYGLKKEAWVEYDESGNISNVRVNYSWPKQDMVQIWKDGKAQQWSKESNRITYINDKNFSDKVLYFGQRYNPRGAIQYLYERQANGKIIIEIEEPSDKAKPIAITANYPPNTYLLGKDISAMREIFFVDQNTKLITAVEIYELKDGVYEYTGVWKSFKYDEPFEAGIFDLEDEVPDDVKRLSTIN